DQTLAQIINCTFSGNRAVGDGNGGAIFNYVSSGILLQNSIIWGNDAVIRNPEFENTSDFILVNTLVKGINPGGTNPDGTNPANDPLFTAQPTPGLTTSGDLQLRLCSPAINAGSPATTTAVTGATDLAGQPRIFGNRIDLGAYEVQSAPVSLSLALATPAGTTLSCSAAALPVNAVATGGSNFTYTFTGSGLPGTPSTTASATVSNAGTFTVASQNAEGCVVSGTVTVTGSSTPVGAVTISSLTGNIGCGSNQVAFNASSGGANQYVVMPGNLSATSGSFTLTTAGTYTVSAGNGVSGCEQKGIVSIPQGTNAVAGPILFSGQASGANPGKLSATGTGSLFVFTGPNGFVFSTVHRTSGSYSVTANGVTTPGVYTLTVYGTAGCPPVSSNVTVN
ncbi:choice-of-anchor Q domain-containing protein, partial [Arsenicibacter rosenii]|uniref:choice-of-anchor Q domain-containing protein n=1 Tax=Arsenicibacter rosenii TaxID=1750698 RepID=UPI0015A7060C